MIMVGYYGVMLVVRGIVCLSVCDSVCHTSVGYFFISPQKRMLWVLIRNAYFLYRNICFHGEISREASYECLLHTFSWKNKKKYLTAVPAYLELWE